MKNFKGKIIRHPDGKAGEYSYIAADAWFGCSNDCTYCYLKKGFLGRMFTNPPHLKAGIKDNNHAFELFKIDVEKIGIETLQKYGIFLNFESDPFLKETKPFTQRVVQFCCENKIPLKLLTKSADWVFDNSFPAHWGKGGDECINEMKKYVAIGYTLTGRDDLEPNASTNAERIEAMSKLHEAGFKTWASIEPVIDFESSYEMVIRTNDFCDLYKIGLESGKKYKKPEVYDFVDKTLSYAALFFNDNEKIYFKDRLLKQAGINREDLPSNCVTRDYNMFNE